MIDFQIKICGITNPTDALKACEFGADAIGLNFYAKSLRSVTTAAAKELVDQLPSDLTKVGVFVNEAANTVNEICTECRLDYAQLHGDESPDLIQDLSFKAIRAIRVSNYETAKNEINDWITKGITAVLLDAAAGRQYGGTGKQLDWEPISDLQLDVPLILAGGLNCDNVSRAISVAKPNAVDVASGIEKFPGSKDHGQMQAFISSAIDGFSH